MAGHYWVTLDAAERAALEEITRTGVRAAKTVLYAHCWTGMLIPLKDGLSPLSAKLLA